jgi:hypothetical protein
LTLTSRGGDVDAPQHIGDIPATLPLEADMKRKQPGEDSPFSPESFLADALREAADRAYALGEAKAYEDAARAAETSEVFCEHGCTDRIAAIIRARKPRGT